MTMVNSGLKGLKPEFIIIIFIHYKPRPVVDEDDLKWVANQFIIKQLHKIPRFQEVKSFIMQNDVLMHCESLMG